MSIWEVIGLYAALATAVLVLLMAAVTFIIEILLKLSPSRNLLLTDKIKLLAWKIFRRK